MKYILSLILLAIIPLNSMAAVVCVQNTLLSKKIETCLNGKNCKRFTHNIVRYEINKPQDKLKISGKGIFGFQEIKTLKGRDLADKDTLKITAKKLCDVFKVKCIWYYKWAREKGSCQ